MPPACCGAAAHAQKSSPSRSTTMLGTRALGLRWSTVRTSSTMSAGWICSSDGSPVQSVIRVATKAGEIAVARTPCSASSRFSEFVNAIKAAYQNQGHLDLKLTVETNFDEGAGVANYRIAVEEGKPFQMGEVVIKNASEDEQKRIRDKWRLAPGAVFNFGYVRDFVKKLSEDRRARTPRVRLQANRANQTADVLFTF